MSSYNMPIMTEVHSKSRLPISNLGLNVIMTFIERSSIKRREL